MVLLHMMRNIDHLVRHTFSRRVSYLACGLQIEHDVFKLNRMSSRLSSSLGHTSQKQESGNTDNSEFTRIYKFPGIHYCRLLCRMKLYQTAISVIMLPPISFIYYSGGPVSDALLWSSYGVAGFAGFMLYTMTGFWGKIIGLLSVNCDETILRVSHLTFWGRRKDIFVPVGSVVPLSELPDRPHDVYVVFRRYDSEEKLYLSLQWGGVENKKVFTRIFGSETPRQC